MTVSEARRLKELEHENARLKRLLADAELDKAALKDLAKSAPAGAVIAAFRRAVDEGPPNPRS